MSGTKASLALVFMCVVTTACSGSGGDPTGSAPKHVTAPTSEVVSRADVEWGALNPARGDRSPKAGALWGDRAGAGPAGFLVQFVDGFSSPPHVHNVSYRGVVIAGLLHNDDPGAGDMWMPAGSYWTQPAGEAHITAANGNENLAYIEIEEGPYLVGPTEDAFDNGERPVNVHASNLVWIDPPEVLASAGGPKLAYLWGNPGDVQLRGILLKLPAGFAGEIRGHGSTLRAVVIKGRALCRAPGGTNLLVLEPGSYFGSEGESAHQVSCETGTECLIYVRVRGKLDVN